MCDVNRGFVRWNSGVCFFPRKSDIYEVRIFCREVCGDFVPNPCVHAPAVYEDEICFHFISCFSACLFSYYQKINFSVKRLVRTSIGLSNADRSLMNSQCRLYN